MHSRFIALISLALLSTLLACEPPATTPPPPDGDGDGDDDAIVPEPLPTGITFVDVTEARDVSPDGRTVLLEALGFGVLSLFDVATGTLTEVTTMPFVERNQALGVSNNGRISAEVGNPIAANLWLGDGWLDIGSPFAGGCVNPGSGDTTDIAGAWDVSADGEVVVGMAWDGCTPAAYRWQGGAFTVLERLGTPFADSDRENAVNRASVISDDGLVAAGWAENGPVDRSPAIWNTDGSGFLLDPNDQDRPGEILSITADGHAFAGVWANEGFVYTAEQGETFIGRFPESLPFDGVFPNAIALDGELLFGTNGGVAFVWTPTAGLRKLRDVVIASGIEVPDDTLFTNVGGVSSDGSVVIGTALDFSTDPFGAQTSFVLVLPVTAYAE